MLSSFDNSATPLQIPSPRFRKISEEEQLSKDLGITPYDSLWLASFFPLAVMLDYLFLTRIEELSKMKTSQLKGFSEYGIGPNNPFTMDHDEYPFVENGLKIEEGIIFFLFLVIFPESYLT